jgi:hypothetical protein
MCRTCIRSGHMDQGDNKPAWYDRQIEMRFQFTWQDSFPGASISFPFWGIYMGIRPETPGRLGFGFDAKVVALVTISLNGTKS